MFPYFYIRFRDIDIFPLSNDNSCELNKRTLKNIFGIKTWRSLWRHQPSRRSHRVARVHKLLQNRTIDHLCIKYSWCLTHILGYMVLVLISFHSITKLLLFMVFMNCIMMLLWVTCIKGVYLLACWAQLRKTQRLQTVFRLWLNCWWPDVNQIDCASEVYFAYYGKMYMSQKMALICWNS